MFHTRHAVNALPTDHFKRNITVRYVVALSLVAGLAVLSYVMFRHVMDTIDHSAEMTAVTGSQRLLIQRVLAQCLLLAAADDEESRRAIRAHLARFVDLLEKNHQRLLADLNDPNSFAAHAPELMSIYFKQPFELDKRMRFFIASTRTFYHADADRPSLSDPKFQHVLAFGENELRDLTAVVQAYQHRAVSRLTILRQVEAWATGGMLLLLTSVGVCILRPMVRRICADRERLQGANEALTELAVTDQLTGAYNRLKFNQVMGHELKRLDRYGPPFSVIMFDIDHFKIVNDTHGHAAGDAMLRELSRRVSMAVRGVDWLFRYGGEEFVVAAPHTDLDQARVLAEKLRNLVADTPFPHDIPGTISLGVAQAHPGDTPESLMQRVDAALYEAKDTGRNRVVVAAQQ
ncbi:diguanylate cyclase [Solidesulfovibrio fructosivorans JJ]]|uniref:diguanylate cyclase n=1 Tax=Solidesulfovibrio fructosivorans JJ] TaxID=596151 RepID=E1K2G2_SOLFR|nr:GGDEF domain-containing protein [Solidesulfovibrio fructosivorans]EFL49195.1 diguanylate cyclase [Solidesulfovibrio fructosivorans JJ]]